jgi:hypothetical protein
MAAVNVICDKHMVWRARAKEAFPKDPVSHNKKTFAVGRYRSLLPQVPMSLRLNCIKLQVADHAPGRQTDRVLRKGPPSPIPRDSGYRRSSRSSADGTRVSFQGAKRDPLSELSIKGKEFPGQGATDPC